MPRASGKINDLERRICARLKELRERLGHSQRVFAAALGISRDQLAGLEYNAAPLRIETAIRLSRLTGCNLNWLAEGSGPVYGPLPSPDFIGQIPSRALFSQAWDKYLKPALRAGAKQFGEAPVSNASGDSLSAQEYCIEEIKGYLKFIPPEFHWGFFSNLTKTGRDFVAMNQVKIAEHNTIRKKKIESDLTDSESYGIPFAVKLQMPNLLDRLNKATEEAGKMSVLAKFLSTATGQKVPLASVSRWLSGKREPGGEITLLMQRWVELQERQK